MKRTYKFAVKPFSGKGDEKFVTLECKVLSPHEEEAGVRHNGRMSILPDGNFRIFEFHLQVIEEKSSKDWMNYFDVQLTGRVSQIKSRQRYEMYFNRKQADNGFSRRTEESSNLTPFF